MGPPHRRRQEVTKGDTYGLAIGYADTYYPWKFIWSLTSSRAAPSSARTARPPSRLPQVQKAVADYFGILTKDHVVNPKAVGWKDADVLTAFATGKAAIFPMSTATAIPTLDKSAVKGKYAFAALPSVPFGATSRPAGPAATTIVSGDNVAIASYTKNLDLALAYVKIISSPAMQAEQYTDFGNLPSNAAALTTVDPGQRPAGSLHRGGEGRHTDRLHGQLGRRGKRSG